MKKIFFVCIAAMLLTGCYSVKQVSMQDDYEHACIGLTKAEIIAQFGEPTRQLNVPEKGDMFLYETFVEGDTKAKGTSLRVDGQPMENRRYLEVFFNDQGVCKKVNTNLTKDQRYKDEKKTTRVMWGSIAGGIATTAAVFFATMLTTRK